MKYPESLKVDGFTKTSYYDPLVECKKRGLFDGLIRKGNRQLVPLNNFGDLLGPLIVKKILKKYNLSKYLSAKRLFTIGSVIHFAHDFDNIWGSGINGKVGYKSHKFNNLDVHALRGPLSKEYLVNKGIHCPSNFGDPALLMPYFFPKYRINKIERDVIVIPNYNESLDDGFPPKIKILSPLCNPLLMIDQITKSRLTISSSLHAIIIAEAYGRKGIFLKTRKEDPFKYRDYLLGTGRSIYEPAETVNEALQAKPMSQAIFDCEMILKSFPFHLYK